MKNFGLAILIVFALAQAQELSAKTVYTATNGNDSASGGIDSPYRTIKKCISVMAAGDTCLIRGGTYSEIFNGVYGAAGTPVGTSFSNAITIKAFPGERVTWTYTGGDYIFALVTDSYPNHRSFYYILQDIIFDGAGVVAFPLSGLASDHQRFERLEVKNAYGSGIQTGGSFLEFLDLNVHDNGSCAGAHGIYLGGGSDNLIDGGSYYNNYGYGVHVYSTTGNTNRHTVRNAKIYHNNYGTGGQGVGTCTHLDGGGGGLIITSGADNVAYNNLIYNNKRCGASISESGASVMNKLYNNTLYGNECGIIIGSGATSAQVKNNLIYNNGGNGILDWQSVRPSISNNYTSDPLFTNPTVGDFTVRSSSGTIDAGIDLSATFTNDMMGTPRPLGGAFDVGAYEFGGGSTSPLSAPKNLRTQ